jgi:rhamnulokinase
MNGNFLALDLGAESGRAMLAHLADGKIELTELHRFLNTPVQLPTGLYWDALRLFHEICEGIRSAAASGVALDGLAVDTWGVDFGLIGSNGELLQNPRHYRDERTQGVPEEVFTRVSREEIFRQTGLQFMPINSLYQLHSIQRDSPEVLPLTSKLLFMPDLFNYFLTGTFAAERTIASTSQFYNPVKKTFATDLLRSLGISCGFFPRLIDPGVELGNVLPYTADRCGLKRDLTVYTTASHDTASAVAAVPASEGDHWCYISSGTWSLMGVELQQPVLTDAALAANFTNEVGVDGTIRFLKNIPGLWVLQECRRAWAKEGHEYSYADLMEAASTASPTRTILNLEEFIAPGNHPARICEFCRQTEQEIPTDPGAMTLVILQSLAIRYRDVLDTLEQLTNRTIDVIHIVGGGSQNRLLNQLAADFTGRRVVAGPTEATAAGNALVQAMGTGDIHSLGELRSVVRASFGLQEFTPRAHSQHAIRTAGTSR